LALQPCEQVIDWLFANRGKRAWLQIKPIQLAYDAVAFAIAHKPADKVTQAGLKLVQQGA
jgi:hypothetical protein